MLKYKILRWDPVMFGNSNNKYPLITIKPDEKFLTFSNANKSNVSCEITVNNVTRTFDGVVNKSSNVPNCRPNYFAATGNYVITLKTEWKGYPKNSDLKNLGTISFSPVIDGTVKLQTPEYKTVLSKSSDSDVSEETAAVQKSNSALVVYALVVCSLVVVFVIVFLLYKFFKYWKSLGYVKPDYRDDYR
jgi:hypothetical protein